MKRFVVLAGVVFGLASLSFAGRNFSGVWRMTPISQLAPVDTVLNGAALITINMSANKLTLIADSPRLFNEYIMDGDDHKVDTRQGPMTYATSWEGDTLVIRMKPLRNPGPAAHTIRFAVAENGLTLQITCTRDGETSPRDVLLWENR